MTHTAHTAGFFETKVRYEKTTDEGTLKMVSELYAVDALSFTEAEKRITEKMQPYISGGYSVSAIKIAQYREVLVSDEEGSDFWYKFRIQFEVQDEKTAKVKKTYSYYLVQAKTVDKAKKAICEYLNDSMIDWKVNSVAETQILDVYMYNKKK